MGATITFLCFIVVAALWLIWFALHNSGVFEKDSEADSPTLRHPSDAQSKASVKAARRSAAKK